MKPYAKLCIPKEIDALITRFEQQLLPKVEWTHEAHLVVAIWYVYQHGFEEALPIVRRLIKAHNSSVGTPNTDQEGYHESITRFWLLVATRFIQEKQASVYAHCKAFLNASTSDSKYPLSFYSEGTLFSVMARREWVEPDLKHL
jgi:hypothetical protein